MAVPRDILEETMWASQPHIPRIQLKKNGWNGDHTSVYEYTGSHIVCTPLGFHPTTRQPFVISAGRGVHNPSYSFVTHSGIPPWAQPSANKAYAKFKEKALGENSQLGASAAEGRESLGMVANRAVGLRKAYSAMRKGDLKRSLEHLGLTPLNKHKKLSPKAVAKNASGTWLEYWFGWSPMIGDMYNAGKVLTQPVPGGSYYGTSGGSNYSSDFQVGYMSEPNWQREVIRHKVGADVYLENPDLFLLSQLGLANPAAVAWEVIPFSFMVDWVFKFSNFIESYTDFLGLRVDKAYRTHLLKFTAEDELKAKNAVKGIRTKREGYVMIRRHGLIRPMPNTQVFRNLGTSRTRVATALSLLTQVLVK